MTNTASCKYTLADVLMFVVQNTDRAKDDIKKALSVLNQQLETRTFLVGERISLADIAVASNLLLLYKWVSIKNLIAQSLLF